MILITVLLIGIFLYFGAFIVVDAFIDVIFNAVVAAFGVVLDVVVVP